MKAILGKKVGASSLFLEEKVIPVTLIQAGPCYITQIKTKEKDGYFSIQLGFEKAKKLNKPKLGHLKKLSQNLKTMLQLKILKEFRFPSGNESYKKYKIGDEIKVDIFDEDESVDVSEITKGKGFTGVVKRWGHKTGPMSHGSDHHREPGSIGSMFPQRVLKGKKMPGRAGGERLTVKNLKVVKIDPHHNLLVVKGAVPGPRGTILEIKTEKDKEVMEVRGPTKVGDRSEAEVKGES